MATDQQLDIRVHGAQQTQSPVHGGIIPPHGGVGGPGIGPVHGSTNAFIMSSLFAGGIKGIWYDPSDFSKMFQDLAGVTTPVTGAGQSVGKIYDKSGNAFHAVATGLGTRPVLQQDASGYWYLAFDGIASLMTATWTSIPQPVDRVSALRQDTWGVNRYMFDGGVVDEMILRQNGVTPALELYAGAAACNNAAATLGTPQCVTERFNGASSSLIIGSTTVNGNVGAQGCSGITMGGRQSSGAPYCPYRLYGVVIRPQMTANQLSNAQASLKTKSGAA